MWSGWCATVCVLNKQIYSNSALFAALMMVEPWLTLPAMPEARRYLQLFAPMECWDHMLETDKLNYSVMSWSGKRFACFPGACDECIKTVHIFRGTAGVTERRMQHKFHRASTHQFWNSFGLRTSHKTDLKARLGVGRKRERERALPFYCWLRGHVALTHNFYRLDYISLPVNACPSCSLSRTWPISFGK